MRVLRASKYTFKPYYNIKQLRPLPELLDLHQVYYCMKFGVFMDKTGNIFRFSDLSSRMEEVPEESREDLDNLTDIFKITKGGK